MNFTMNANRGSKLIRFRLVRLNEAYEIPKHCLPERSTSEFFLDLDDEKLSLEMKEDVFFLRLGIFGSVKGRPGFALKDF